MAVTTLDIVPARTHMPWWPAAAAAAALARGELIVLRHESGIALVGCADTVTTQQMAFIARHSTGRVQVVMPPSPGAAGESERYGPSAPEPVSICRFGCGLTPAAVALALADAALPASSGAVVGDLTLVGVDGAEVFAQQHGLTIVSVAGP